MNRQPLTQQERRVFHDSLERVIHGEKDFLTKFYDIFLSYGDEIRDKFAGTDFRKQKQALRASFYFVLYATDGKPEALAQLDKIAKRHSKSELNIEPRLYDLWKAALIATVEQCDPRFDDEVRQAWNRMSSVAIQHLTDRYWESI